MGQHQAGGDAHVNWAATLSRVGLGLVHFVDQENCLPPFARLVCPVRVGTRRQGWWLLDPGAVSPRGDGQVAGCRSLRSSSWGSGVGLRTLPSGPGHFPEPAFLIQ